MVQEYTVTGMTCSGCLGKVKQSIEQLEEIKEVRVQLDYPQAIIEFDKKPDLTIMNDLLSQKGNYRIYAEKLKQQLAPLPVIKKKSKLPAKSLSTYKPLLIIVAFILGTSILVQFPFHNFSYKLLMRHFMAGFFLAFSFFKLLNVRGFSTSYAMYDIIAKKWPAWGLIYPFTELALGILYLVNLAPLLTNITTIVVLGISSIGVIQSNLSKQEIKCACLGDVFNLPMSTVTIVEDIAMVLMAMAMLLW